MLASMDRFAKGLVAVLVAVALGTGCSSPELYGPTGKNEPRSEADATADGEGPTEGDAGTDGEQTSQDGNTDASEGAETSGDAG